MYCPKCRKFVAPVSPAKGPSRCCVLIGSFSGIGLTNDSLAFSTPWPTTQTVDHSASQIMVWMSHCWGLIPKHKNVILCSVGGSHRPLNTDHWANFSGCGICGPCVVTHCAAGPPYLTQLGEPASLLQIVLV